LNHNGRESLAMGIVSGCFDESGKLQDSRWVVFAGYVARVDEWAGFGHRWNARLAKDKLLYFSMKECMSFEGQFRAGDWTDDRRRSLVLDLAAVLAKVPDIEAIVSPMSVLKFKSLSQTEQNSFGKNPQYMAFETCVRGMDRMTQPGDIINLICDDEQQLAIGCYKLLNKLKARHAGLRKKIAGICFMNDEKYPPVQAADLLAYVSRTRIDSDCPYYSDDSLVEIWEALTKPFEQPRLSVLSYGTEGLGYGDFKE
jgi:hypothetical protein